MRVHLFRPRENVGVDAVGRKVHATHAARRLTAVGCALLVAVLLLPALAAAHVWSVNHANGWVVDTNEDDANSGANPADDGMYVMTSYNGANGFTDIDYIMKPKFIEVGSSPNQLTRYDLSSGASGAGVLGLVAGTHVHNGGVVGTCNWDSFETDYSGAYGQWTIEFAESYTFYSGPDCLQLTATYAGWVVNGNPTLYWRFVVVENPILNTWNVAPAIKNYNGAAQGTYVTINENSITPTPGDGVLSQVRIQAIGAAPQRTIFVTMPWIQIQPNIIRANDVVGVLNIGSDPKWQFDRRPSEVLHDSTGGAGDPPSATNGNDDVLLFDIQTGIYYGTPASSYSCSYIYTYANL
jgi:hypothetical protein